MTARAMGSLCPVTPGLVPGIHVFAGAFDK